MEEEQNSPQPHQSGPTKRDTTIACTTLHLDLLFNTCALFLVFCDFLSILVTSLLRSPGWTREENWLSAFIHAAWPFCAARGISVFMDWGFFMVEEEVIMKLLEGDGQDITGEMVQVKRFLERKVKWDWIGRALAYGVFVVVFWRKGLTGKHCAVVTGN
jgi:hypothetical protein